MTVISRVMANNPVPTKETAARSGINLFRKEGEYWTIAYEDKVVRLRDAKGMHVLAHLLSHPGERLPVGDLLLVTESARRETSRDDENARVTVTKRIKAALARIQQHHPSLGHHLATCVKTGACCVYLPHPERQANWCF